MTGRDELIHDHIYLVRLIAGKIFRKYPQHIEFDDFVQSGMIGLIDAAEKFKPEFKTTFKTYAGRRITGAIIDYLRFMNPLSRNVYDDIKQIEYAKDLLEVQGKESSIKRLSEVTQISEQNIHELRISGAATLTSQIDEVEDLNHHKKDFLFSEFRDKADAFDFVFNKQKKKIIQKSFKCLTPKERFVLSRYFFDDVFLGEIALEMRVTESRTCQLLKSGLEKLREWFKYNRRDVHFIGENTRGPKKTAVS